mgnify:FL=1
MSIVTDGNGNPVRDSRGNPVRSTPQVYGVNNGAVSTTPIGLPQNPASEGW